MFERWQDVRYALRSLRRAPGYAAATVVTLTVAIGANTTIFSLLDAVLFKPLPVPAPDELFLLYETDPRAATDVQGGTGARVRFSYPLFQKLERALPEDTSLAAMSRVVRFNVRAGNETVASSALVQLVSGRFFETFGLTPAAGRLLTDDDNRTIDSHHVAILSHAAWRRWFGSAAFAPGQMVTINRVPFEVVGVVPPAFTGVWTESPVAAWIPWRCNMPSTTWAT